jgi:cell division protein FtsI/penicillin-binding protein 2
MLRREALVWLAAEACAAMSADAEPSIAVLVDVPKRRLLTIRGGAAAGRVLLPPGSTLKPLVLAALLKRGKLTDRETFACPGSLTIAGRQLNCSHPRMDIPMRVETALAYSCNCFVAHMAERFEPGELASELVSSGLVSSTDLLVDDEVAGRISPARGPDAIRLQALGEAGVAITAAELAMAYRLLALHAPPAIVAGLEGAVEYGTAQNARVRGVTVAGKTGSVRMENGERVAWFAGFLPSRQPEAAIAVMLQGRSGGSDAAPVAAGMLEAYRAGKL